MVAAVHTTDMSQLASCHDSAGNVDVAIHLIQQCIEILRQNLPSMRKDLCAGECKRYGLVA